MDHKRAKIARFSEFSGDTRQVRSPAVMFPSEGLLIVTRRHRRGRHHLSPPATSRLAEFIRSLAPLQALQDTKQTPHPRALALLSLALAVTTTGALGIGFYTPSSQADASVYSTAQSFDAEGSNLTNPASPIPDSEAIQRATAAERAQRGTTRPDTRSPSPEPEPSTSSASPTPPPAPAPSPTPSSTPCDTRATGDAACQQIPNLSEGAWIRPTHGRVTSEFGSRWGRQHSGIDIAPEQGTPVYAASDGTVVEARCSSAYCDGPGYLGLGGYGNVVKIDHADGVQTRYAHLLEYVVSSGTHVRAGQLIGFVGSTGNSTGPHLHFETRVGGEAVNPVGFMADRGVDLYVDAIP